MPTLTEFNSFKTLIGTVVGTKYPIPNTLRVRVDEMVWNKKVQKYYPSPYKVLVYDPQISCFPGDVIQFRNNFKSSEDVKHVVTKILVAHTVPLEQRPDILSNDQLRLMKESGQQKSDLHALATTGDDQAANRLLESSLSKESVQLIVDIIERKRHRFITLWKETISQVPDPKGTEGTRIPREITDELGLRWWARDLLLVLKPTVITALSNAGAESKADRRKSANIRLPQEWKVYTDLYTLHQLLVDIASVLRALGDQSSEVKGERQQKSEQQSEVSESEPGSIKLEDKPNSAEEQISKFVETFNRVQSHELIQRHLESRPHKWQRFFESYLTEEKT